jgi:hypothetical protein
MREDKEKAVEKEQGKEILQGAEHDEINASEMENISGGTPGKPTTPPTGGGIVIAPIAVLIG